LAIVCCVLWDWEVLRETLSLCPASDLRERKYLPLSVAQNPFTVPHH
jgi:hypothetical protein